MKTKAVRLEELRVAKELARQVLDGYMIPSEHINTIDRVVSAISGFYITERNEYNIVKLMRDEYCFAASSDANYVNISQPRPSKQLSHIVGMFEYDTIPLNIIQWSYPIVESKGIRVESNKIANTMPAALCLLYLEVTGKIIEKVLE